MPRNTATIHTIEESDVPISNTDASPYNVHRQKKIDFKDFKKYLDDIAATKKISLDELKSKLVNCGEPGTNNATVSTLV